MFSEVSRVTLSVPHFPLFVHAPQIGVAVVSLANVVRDVVHIVVDAVHINLWEELVQAWKREKEGK
jgi:hypothetical protein